MDAMMIEQNRQEQCELYGRPVVELLRELSAGLGLGQARLAEVLGLPMPLLTELSCARRGAVTHPHVLVRLQALVELAARADALSPAAIAASLAEIAARQAPSAGDDIVAVLSCIGGHEALVAAADAAQELSPSLAELLREAAARVA